MPPKRRPQLAAMDAGDELSYSLSAEVRKGGLKVLVTFGSRTTLRASESPLEARERLCAWVEDGLDTKVNDLLADA